MSQKSNCPITGEAFKHTTLGGDMIKGWWPNQLNLKILHQNPPTLRPTGNDFDYAKEFSMLDYDGLKNDLRHMMTESQQVSVSGLERYNLLG